MTRMKYLIKYSRPEWAKMIKNIPEYFIQRSQRWPYQSTAEISKYNLSPIRTIKGGVHNCMLCQRNTPIHEWNFPGVPEKFKLSIKRDDLTGSSLSGNKVRKLEFLLADAISQNCDSVIAFGGAQSNLCRSTAIAARQLGMKSYLFLRTDEDLGCHGNVLLNRMVGSQFVVVPRCCTYEQDVKPRIEKMAKVLRDQGSNPYIIPLGGWSQVGLFGYIDAFQELIEQGILSNFDDIVLAVGSGGTASAIAIANYLTGSKVRCHGVAVDHYNLTFYDHIDEQIKECGLNVRGKDIINLVDDYIAEGYGKSTEEELACILKVSLESGIILDRVYTAKAVHGMVMEMQNNPGRFKGRRVLFLHTGGMFSLFDGELNNLLLKTDETNMVSWLWKNLEDPAS